MKYELGDKVRIKKHWKRKKLYDNHILKNKSLEEHLSSDDMSGDSYRFEKYKKEWINEYGLVVGVRTFKITADFMWDEEHEEDYGEFGTQVYKARIIQVDEKYETVYLVATRMNCLRRVSIEDIEFIKNGDLK